MIKECDMKLFDKQKHFNFVIILYFRDAYFCNKILCSSNVYLLTKFYTFIMLIIIIIIITRKSLSCL